MTARGDTAPLNVKISSGGMAALDRIATTEGVDRSTLVRALLSDAVTAYEQTGHSPALRRLEAS